MYGLPDTPDSVTRAFAKTSDGTAEDEDFELLGSHIERKKLEIRAAKQMLGIDGVKSRKEPLEYQPLQAIMQILDGGRR